MASSVTMSQTDYESVVAIYETLKNSDLAYNETLKPLLDELKLLLTSTDVSNSLSRYYLCIRWQDLTTRPADYANYPPTEQSKLHSYTAFVEQAVVDFVASQTSRSANIMVTDDPSGNVGWQDLDTFF